MYVLCTVRNVRSIDRSAFAFAVSVSNMASCGMEFYRQRLLSFVYAFRRDLCSNKIYTHAVSWFFCALCAICEASIVRRLRLLSAFRIWRVVEFKGCQSKCIMMHLS